MNIEKKMLSLVAEPHTRFPPLASVIRKFRITADAGKPNETDYFLATAERDSAFSNAKPNRRACRRQDNPTPFNDSDTALRACAFLQSEAIMQVVSEAKDNFRKDDDVRWQPSGARSTAKGSPQGERGGVHQFGVPPKPARRDSANTRPEGIPQVVSAARDNNANFAWVQHFIHHLAPHGMAGRCKVRVQKSELRSFRVFNSTFEIHHSAFVPSSNQSGEGDIRRALIEADREMPSDELRTPNRVSPTSTFEIHPSNFASLPGQLFYSTRETRRRLVANLN